MGKAMRLKGDLEDVEILLEIMNVIKDVATNRFFASAQRKVDYAQFLDEFLMFFEMLGNVETTSPLVKNDNPATDVVVITSEQGFMSQLNGRATSAAMTEYSKRKDSRIICVGRRGAEKLATSGCKVEKVFSLSELPNRSKFAMLIRDYVVDRVKQGITGRVVLVYIYAKTFQLLKPKIITLLPASELANQDREGGEAVAGEGDRSALQAASRVSAIMESNADNMMEALANIWIHSRLFEIICDLDIVEAAAQSQQLESSIESLSTEKNQLRVSFRKAGRDELNKAMREVFTSASVAKKRGK